MFHHILVAIDHSQLGQQVFQSALNLAKAMSASLILLNVLSPDDESSPSVPIITGYNLYAGGLTRSITDIYQELWQAYAEREMGLLQVMADEAIAAGVMTTYQQGFGNPGRIICELAHDLKADLIVVGRRQGRSGLDELFLGSVSNYVLHHAPCSVLTVCTQLHNQIKHLEKQQPAITY